MAYVLLLISDPRAWLGLRLVLALAVVTCAAQLAGVAARRLGQPPVIGEIAAGIALGPSLLGSLVPGSTALLFPSAIRPELDLLAKIGIVLFMFSVGVELDTAVLGGRRRLTVAVSNVSVLVPFAMGVAAAMLLFAPLAGARTSFASFALFLGVALSVTAFPVLARIVEEAGLGSRSLAPIALACAALTDGAAWCLLILVAALARSSSAVDALSTLALTLAFVLAVLCVVRPLLAEVKERLAIGSVPAAVGFPCALGVAFLFAAITDRIGVHVIVGAFLAGLAVGRHGALRGRMGARVNALNRALLLPVFFASVGLHTDLAAVATNPALLGAGALVLAVAVVGKLGATSLVARAGGLPWREAMGLGVLMNTKGLTEIVVLQMGLDLGVISRDAFTVLVTIALITTAAALPALRLLGLADRATSAPAGALLGHMRLARLAVGGSSAARPSS